MIHFSLRLDNAAMYTSDLSGIRNAVRENGSKKKCESILISHPKGAKITVHINFALEPDFKNPPKKSSLALLGFTTKSNILFKFEKNAIEYEDTIKDAHQLSIDGSYKSLGHPMSLPMITDSDLLKSIRILNALKSHHMLRKKEMDAIARLTIVSSEAIKFSAVATGISNVLGNDTFYVPNSFGIIGWGGHSIAS